MDITSITELNGCVRGSLECINITGEMSVVDITECMKYLQYDGLLKCRGIDSIELSRYHAMGHVDTQEYIKYAKTVTTNLNDLIQLFKSWGFVINFADIQEHLYYVIEGKKCL